MTLEESAEHMRPFLRRPDPEREHDRQWARDAYQKRGEQDRKGYPLESMEDFLESANAVARLVLRHE